MKKKPKKLKRRLLGVGHPYFFDAQGRGITKLPSEWPSGLILLDADFGKCKKTIPMSTCGIGAWQKVRVYMEWK